MRRAITWAAPADARHLHRFVLVHHPDAQPHLRLIFGVRHRRSGRAVLVNDRADAMTARQAAALVDVVIPP